MAPDLDHVFPPMHMRVQQLLNDPDAKAIGLFVVSAFRPIAYQADLFAKAVKKYGSPKAAGKWVAPPGHSNHGPTLDSHGNRVADQVHLGVYGGAVDLGIPGTQAANGQWPIQQETRVNRIAARYGLYSPMDWEDWHFEQIPGWKPAPPATAAGASFPPIREGDHGPVVGLWQQLLDDHASEHVTVDGSYGPATVAATHDFLAIAHLPGDGTEVAPPAWTAMLALTK